MGERVGNFQVGGKKSKHVIREFLLEHSETMGYKGESNKQSLLDFLLSCLVATVKWVFLSEFL